MTSGMYVAFCGIENSRTRDNIDIELENKIKIKKINVVFSTSHGWSFKKEHLEEKENKDSPSYMKPWMCIGQDISRESNIEIFIKDFNSHKLYIVTFYMKLLFCYTAFPFFISDRPVSEVKDALYNNKELEHKSNFLSETIPVGGIIYSEGIISKETFSMLDIKSVEKLYDESEKYKLLVEAFISVGYNHDISMSIVKIWSALEKVFSSGAGEIRFRISIYIASYLCTNNKDKKDMQKRISKLYDERSAIAHGRKKVSEEALIESFSILRNCIMKITKEENVPSPENISNMIWE